MFIQIQWLLRSKTLQRFELKVQNKFFLQLILLINELLFRSDDWYSWWTHTHIHTHTDWLTFRMSEKWFCTYDTYPRSTTSSNLVFVNMQSSHSHPSPLHALLLFPFLQLVRKMQISHSYSRPHERKIILPETTINLRWIGEEKSIGKFAAASKKLLTSLSFCKSKCLRLNVNRTHKFLALSTQIIKNKVPPGIWLRGGYWARCFFLGWQQISIPWWHFYDIFSMLIFR